MRIRAGVSQAVALASALVPTVAIADLNCSSCDIQWQAPQELNCMQNPWTWTNAPIAVGKISNPAACGLTGYVDAGAQCASICGSYGPDCMFNGTYFGNGTVSFDTVWCTNLALSDAGAPDTACGRRPDGLERERRIQGVASQLASAAYLEAASVVAFETLHRELAAHHAPRSLRSAATRARRDEQHHARMVGRMAKRRGATVEQPRCERRAPRALVAVAVENAVEGCARNLRCCRGAVAGYQRARRRRSQRHARDRARRGSPRGARVARRGLGQQEPQ